jgi:hypothetical protein
MSERTKAIISAIVVLVANVAALWGVSIDQGVWVNGLCAIVMLVSSIYAIWKNHNFSYAAQQGQLVTNRIKNEKIALEAREEMEDDDE